MNTVQQYLQDYLQIRQSNDDDAYDKLFAQYKELLDKSQENEKKCFKFLPENQVLSFHDATIEGNVKPNIGSDSFDLTIRMLCYQKLEDTSIKYPYQEVDPVYVRFTLDDKHRAPFHKLAVKCSAILAVAYEENNLGIVYLDKDWKTKTFYQEGIDLSNCKPVEHKLSKKNEDVKKELRLLLIFNHTKELVFFHLLLQLVHLSIHHSRSFPHFDPNHSKLLE